MTGPSLNMICTLGSEQEEDKEKKEKGIEPEQDQRDCEYFKFYLRFMKRYYLY